jgi:TolA-binding protein
MRFFLPALAAALLLSHCGNDTDLPPIVGSGSTDDPRAEALFEEARAAEERGETKRAIKGYRKLADEIPFAERAPEARFRQARLLDESGETLEAFDAYQKVISTYQGNGFYEPALKRQVEMAVDAAEGDLKNSFLGLKTSLSADKTVEMLQTCVDNAPRSDIAAKAALMIAEIYAEEGDVARAVPAFRSVVENHPASPQAPEAQFRIGEILLKQAREGNQDQANLSRAEEGFRDYLSQFPGHERNGEPRKLLQSIGSRDLQNTFEIARFYENKGNDSSAKFYYQEVVRRAKSGDLHDRAAARLAALGGE